MKLDFLHTFAHINFSNSWLWSWSIIHEDREWLTGSWHSKRRLCNFGLSIFILNTLGIVIWQTSLKSKQTNNKLYFGFIWLRLHKIQGLKVKLKSVHSLFWKLEPLGLGLDRVQIWPPFFSYNSVLTCFAARKGCTLFEFVRLPRADLLGAIPSFPVISVFFPCRAWFSLESWWIVKPSVFDMLERIQAGLFVEVEYSRDDVEIIWLSRQNAAAADSTLQVDSKKRRLHFKQFLAQLNICNYLKSHLQPPSPIPLLRLPAAKVESLNSPRAVEQTNQLSTPSHVIKKQQQEPRYHLVAGTFKL